MFYIKKLKENEELMSNELELKRSQALQMNGSLTGHRQKNKRK
jgi:hypothetical protein